MNDPVDHPDDASRRALARALRDADTGEPTPDVRDALSRRLQEERRQGTTGYVVAQVLLLAALLVAGAWYFLR